MNSYRRDAALFGLGLVFRVLFWLGFAYLALIWLVRAYAGGGAITLLLAIAGLPLAFFYPLYAWIAGSAFPTMLWAFFLSWICYFISVRLGVSPAD